MNSSQIDGLAKVIDEYPGLFARLEQIAACEAYHPEYDYSQGFAMLMSHVNFFRFAVRAFSARALVNAYQDSGDKALDDCQASLRVASHLRDEPLVVSQLVHLACQDISVRTANHILRVADTSDDARAGLDEVIAQLNNRLLMTDAMKGERAMGVLTFQQIRAGTLDPSTLGDSGSLHKLSRTWIGQAYLNDDEAMYIEVLDKQIAAIEQDRGQRNAELDAMWNEIMNSNRFRHIMTKLLAPALNAAANAVDMREAEIRCLRILLAVEGQPEAQLEQLALPAKAKIDPYSDKPLLMKQVADEWVVYSVGENETDDGGDVRDDGMLDDPALDIGLAAPLEPLDVEAADAEVGVIDPGTE